MVRLAFEERVDPIELLEQDDEGEFVLEGEAAQGDDVVGGRAQGGTVAVGPADEDGDAFDSVELPALHPVGERSRGPDLASLVEGDAQRAFARGELGFAVLLRAGVFSLGAQFHVGVAGEAPAVFLDSRLGMGQGGFSDREDLPLHEGRFFIAPTCNGRARGARWRVMPEDLPTDYLDRFSGIARLYGADALPRLRRARVAVIGTGGVGSWTAEALARSGVGHLALIDPDEVCVTNSNRQLPALAGQYGRPKIAVIAERLRLIHPEIEVEEIPAFFTEASSASLLGAGYDAVVDGIDDAKLKALLVASCRDRGVPLVVSGGAGGKRDPASVRAADLAFATNDRLLRLVRKELRRRYGYPHESNRTPFGVRAVFSVENALYPWSDGTVRAEPEPGSHLRLDCASGFGSAAPVTGAFGFAAAAEAMAIVLGATVLGATALGATALGAGDQFSATKTRTCSA